MDDRSKRLEVINTVNEKNEQNVQFKVLIPEKMNFLNEKKLFFDEIEGKIFLVGNEVKKYEAKTPTFLNGQKLIKYKLLNNMKNLINLTDEGINFMLDKDTVNGNFLKAHATFFFTVFSKLS